MRIVPFLVLASAFALPLGAHAQWQWIDKDNKKVYSDQAPPPEVPEDKILHRPAAVVRRSSTPAPAAAEVAPPVVPASPPKGAGVDKGLEDKARQAREAEDACAHSWDRTLNRANPVRTANAEGTMNVRRTANNWCKRIRNVLLPGHCVTESGRKGYRATYSTVSVI